MILLHDIRRRRVAYEFVPWRLCTRIQDYTSLALRGPAQLGRDAEIPPCRA
jgi:hypothetical protein